jgi:hypothetical protein
MTMNHLGRLAALSVLPLLAGAAPATVNIPGSVIRSTISEPARENMLRSAALTDDGRTAELIVATKARAAGDSQESLVWVSVNESGRVFRQGDPMAGVSRVEARGFSASGPGAGRGLVVAGGRGFIVTPSASGAVRLVELTQSSRIMPQRAVSFGDRSPTVRRVSATRNGIAVLGHFAARPMVVEIDTEGKLVSDLAFGKEEMSVINAIFEADGSVVVAGEKGVLPASTASVSRVSRRGEVLARAAFVGRPIDIARGNDGAYLLLVERSNGEGSEILMIGLASNLTESWTRPVAARQRLGPTFRVAAVPSGGFIVAGTKDRGLWISRVTSDGAEVWTEAHDPMKTEDMEMTSQVEMASAKDTFLVAYTAFVVSGREQHQVVRTIRFVAP